MFLSLLFLVFFSFPFSIPFRLRAYYFTCSVSSMFKGFSRYIRLNHNSSLPWIILCLFILFQVLDTFAIPRIPDLERNDRKNEVEKDDACRLPNFWSGQENVTISVPSSSTSSFRTHFSSKKGGKDDGKMTRRIFELYTPFVQRGNSTVEGCDNPQGCIGPPEERGGYGVVINWHGCVGNYPVLDYTEQISKVVQVAQDRNYYVITPVGTSSGNGNVGWKAERSIPSCAIGDVDDFSFFEAILDFIDRNLCADLSRIYTIGFSNGAFLAHALGCKYSHRLAGIGADAGSLTHTFASQCQNEYSGGLPVQSFHSLSDPVCPYNGTQTWLSQDEVNALWRHRNGCTKEDEKKMKYSFVSKTTVCTRWDCPLAPVESCALKDINHCWYGGRSGGVQNCEPRAEDVDATNHMFDFWEEQSKKKMEQEKEMNRSIIKFE